MKKFLILFLLLAMPCFAQQNAPAAEVPIVSFSQQVEIVVTAKQNRNILEMKFNQDKENITIDLIVDKTTDNDHAKKIALDVIMLTKSKTLDDPPKKKGEPGKGVYDYRVNITVPDGVSLVTAYKDAKKETLSFEDPFHVEPLTRADEGGR